MTLVLFAAVSQVPFSNPSGNRNLRAFPSPEAEEEANALTARTEKLWQQCTGALAASGAEAHAQH
jgi:hypothetical protein